jgi:diguanylate cyclase (GGDEF)-like protein
VSNARLVEEIQFLAYYDGLTQLANRQLGRERLAQAIARAQRHGDGVAVIFLDVDRFKRVNDSLGHAAGDELLRVIARRLSQALRGSDSISRAADELGSLSRQGGDEFIAVLPEIRDPLAVAAVARRIVEELGEPIPLQGQELHVTVSAGIALYPHDGDTPEELIKNADAAMYDAKSSGRDAVRFYRAEMNAEATRLLTVQARLRKALESGGLDVAFQPIAACADGRIVGMEALVRWTDAELGPVSPLELISVAEESGLIEALGDEILEVAARRAVALRLEREDVPGVSVNVSARQFNSPGFAARVGEILRRSGLPPERLVLEITESVMLRRGSDPLATMAALKELGVRIAIDDFGTGYSSLGYLKAFPVDVLKIDRSFVIGIGEDPRDEAIASAIVELGHLLGLRVTAEGVQTEQQFHFLRARGCDSIQGYLLAKPALAGDLPEALKRAQRTAADLTQRTPTYHA